MNHESNPRPNPFPRLTPAQFREAKERAIRRHQDMFPEAYGWNPTPEEFEAFKARDLQLAVDNLKVKDVTRPEDTLHNPLTFARARAVNLGK